jgi:threonine/homoserine/homoserine lactone efflux protein
VAAFGLTLVSGVLVSQAGWLRLVGGVFLCWLGVRTFLAPPATGAAGTGGGPGRWSAWASTFALTLTNPTTILSFAAVFAGLGAGAAGADYREAALIVAGVFIGSAAWWLILSGGVGLFRHRLEPRHLRWVNRVSGGVIAAFGILALASLARAW